MPTQRPVRQTLPVWDLQGLVSDPQGDLRRTCTRLEAVTRRLERLRRRLEHGTGIQPWVQALTAKESMAADVATLQAFAFLWFAENTQDQTARAFQAQARERLTHFDNRTLFVDLAWQRLPKPLRTSILKDVPRLRHYLDTLTRIKPYSLSEREETVVNLKNATGRDALDTLYGVLTARMVFTLRIGSSSRALTREELMVHVRDRSASRRRAAYRELFRVYAHQRDALGEIYKTLVLDWKNEGLDLRGHASPIAVRNTANDVPNAAVDALQAVCRKRAEVFQHYFRLKARLLKRSTLTRYDLYAPVQSTPSTYTFAEAWRLVRDVYHAFSPTLSALVTRVLDDRHVHARPARGKLGGAFCYSVTPDRTPYVLLNYTGQMRDVSTLAHELGHAIHGMLTERLSVMTFHPSLPLAETASIFGEQLLSDHFLSHERNAARIRSLLVNQLDDLYATILRQAYFVEFERTAHEAIARGATIDQLAQLYLHLLREQFGAAVSVPEDFQWEWLAIPHMFSSPFYCYAYSFGNLLVMALFQRYKREGAAFVPRYLELLSAGGSASPERLLKRLKVDIRTTEFWEEGFRRIRDLINALDANMP